MKKQLLILTIVILSLTATAQIQLDSVIVCGQSSYTITLQNPASFNAWMKQGEGEIVLSQTMEAKSSGWYHVYSANPGGTNDIFVCNTLNASNGYTSILNVPSGYIISGIQNAMWGTPNTNCSNPAPSSCNLDVTSIVSRSLIGYRNFEYHSGQFPDPCVGTQKILFLKLRCTPFVHDSIYVGILPFTSIQINDTISCNGNPVEFNLPPLNCDTLYQFVDSLNLPINNTTISTAPIEQGQLYRIKVKNSVSYGGGAGNQADGAYNNYPLTPIANILWRYNGNEYGGLNTFRPEPDGYNPNHIYYFYIMGDGNPQDIGAYDCCLGDNSGFYTFVIEKVLINQNCGSHYQWSNGQIGESINVNPSNAPNIVYIRNGGIACPIDTFMVFLGNNSSSQTQTSQNSYTWPVNNQTYTQSGTYTAVIPNSLGCDSTITLNLTLNFNGSESTNTTTNVPGAISYQAVARNAQGAPLADTNVQVQFTLIADSLSGSEEYVETHTLSTNSLGLFTTAFGAGTPVSNTFGNINWSAGNKYLNVQIDTGNGLVDMGTQQLLSTPYSLYSAKAGEIKNPGLPVFSDNAAALASGLVAGDMYRTSTGDLKIVY